MDKPPELDFFDCNVWLGRPMNLPSGHFGPTDFSAVSLRKDLDRAGIGGALVWHIAQRDTYPLTGNELVTQAVAGVQGLVPCWSILPTQGGEVELDGFFAAAREAGVKAFRAFPGPNRYPFRAEVVGDWLERMTACRVPLVLSVPGDVSWDGLYDLMRDFPELTVIVTSMGAWGSDRLFRPLLDAHPNVYVETSGHIVDGGVEAFVTRYGPGRLLFGSGYPALHFGGCMLMVAHAQIEPQAKSAIAGGNFRRLMGQVKL